MTTASAPAYTRSYFYDPWGNIKNFNGVTLNYATNSTGAPATNRLANDSTGFNYSYDAAGNMTTGAGQSYNYDGANRLKEVLSGNSNYGYDGDGRRVRATDSGASVFYFHSSKLGQVAMEVNSSGVRRAYVYSGRKLLVALQSTDGQFYWLHKNHLGNSSAMTDVSGNLIYKGQFDPYGQALLEWASSGNANLNTKKFTGYERDAATGLDYADARMYNLTRGRFTSPDPLGINATSERRPQTLNRYSYVNNDPVNFVDPGGTCIAVWEWINEGYGKWQYYLCNIEARGGGRGGGGQGGRGGGARNPQSTAVNEFLESYPECKGEVNKKGDKSIQETLNNSTWIVTTENHPDLGRKLSELGFKETDFPNPATVNKTLGEYFQTDSEGRGNVGLTNPRSQKVWIKPGVGGDTYFHETLHLMFGTHSDIINKFNIPTYEVKLPDGRTFKPSEQQRIDLWVIIHRCGTK